MPTLPRLQQATARDNQASVSFSLPLTQQLLCEDVNVERFFPVLYPKV